MMWAMSHYLAIGMMVVSLTMIVACGSQPLAGGVTGRGNPATSTAPPVTLVGEGQAAEMTPTPIPQRIRLPLPTRHPMATSWMLGVMPGVIERITRLSVTDDGELYLLDNVLHKIARFDRDGQFVTAWGRQGYGPGEFTFQIEGGSRASVMAATPDGQIYIADATNRIQRFDDRGRLLTVFNVNTPAAGQVLRVGGLAVDGSGNLYVTDADGHRVQKYDRDGNAILGWGAQGIENGQFQAPMSIVVDRQGSVYVADSLSRIQKFDATGRYITGWGVRGDGDGEFRAGLSMAVSPQGIIVATDSINNRVQAFDADGNYLTQWGNGGSEIGQLSRPGSVAIDGQGHIYVAESLNRRVQKFEPRIIWPTTTRGTPTPRPPTPTATATSIPAPVGAPPSMTPTDR